MYCLILFFVADYFAINGSTTGPATVNGALIYWIEVGKGNSSVFSDKNCASLPLSQLLKVILAMSTTWIGNGLKFRDFYREIQPINCLRIYNPANHHKKQSLIIKPIPR